MNRNFLVILFFAAFIASSVQLERKFSWKKLVDNFKNSNGDQLQEETVTLEKEFEEELKIFEETHERTDRLNDLLEYIEEGDTSRQAAPSAKTSSYCNVCRFFLNYLINGRRAGFKREYIANYATNLCTLVGQTREVCKALIDMNINITIYIIDKDPTLNATTVCSLVVPTECGGVSPVLGFTVNVDNTAPPVTSSKSDHNAQSSGDLKILHITDLHYDRNYLVDGMAVCKEPICCRKSKGIAKAPNRRAGYWGDYRSCDMPLHALQDAIIQISNYAKDNAIDMVYYTGDIVDHGIWETSKDGNFETIKTVHSMLNDSFHGIPFYPIVGNHETHPVNMWPAVDNSNIDEFSIKWLYNNITVDYPKYWLPADTASSLEAGGYYTVLVKAGFRIIALNNNDCYTYNFWILTKLGRDAMAEQLQWFHDTLLAAEKAGEKVHVLAHIPIGEGSCYKTWSREYRKIIERFHKTIGAQFHGHSHRVEFNVHYARSKPSKAINVAWNGGSVTPYSNVNPNYNVYYVDNTYYQVTNLETWIYNLTEANTAGSKTSPRWYKLYDFNEAFGLSDLSPAALDTFVNKLSRNKNELFKLWTYKVKAGDASLKMGCTVQNKCLSAVLCDIVNNEPEDLDKCNQLSKLLSATKP